MSLESAKNYIKGTEFSTGGVSGVGKFVGSISTTTPQEDSKYLMFELEELKKDVEGLLNNVKNLRESLTPILRTSDGVRVGWGQRAELGVRYSPSPLSYSLRDIDKQINDASLDIANIIEELDI